MIRAGRRPGRGALAGPGRALVAAVAVAASSSPALAHGSESGIHGTLLPVGLFLAGVVVLGAAVYLDAAERVDRRVADAGVLVGVVSVLASIAVYWL